MEAERDCDAGLSRPAPGALKVVQGFINSRDLEEGRDGFQTPEQLQAWLAGRGLLGRDDSVGAEDLRRAMELREALRRLLFANNGEPLDSDAAATLNRLAATLPLRLQVQGEGAPTLQPLGSGAPAGLAQILAIVYTAMADGSWRRFKACRDDVCQWAFYDYSKNQSHTWCTMASCGNRNKVRAYQRRRRSQT